MTRGALWRFAPAAVYELACAPEDLPPGLRLRSDEWGVLFSITGRHTVAQIAGTLAIERAQLESALGRLIDTGLAVERSLSLEEYLAAAAATGEPEPVSLSRFLRGRGIVPYSAGQAHPAPGEVDQPFEPLPLPDNEDFTMRPTADIQRKLSLRALLRAFMDHAANEDAGQLDIYRTFLRIEPALLRRNGITTLRLEDDRVVIDPELVAAIESSSLQTLGSALPSNVFIE